MANWTNEPQPFGANHTPLLTGISSVNGVTPVPVAVDPATGGLVVSATISTAGIATSSNQTSGSQKTQLVDAGGEVATITGGKLDVNASIDTTGLATSAIQTDKSQFTKLTDGTDTALITASGEQNVLATAQPGVDIGDVTINNASGAAAVNIQDGGNSITIDGSITASGNKTNNNAAPSTDNVGVLSALVNASSPTFTEGNQSLLSINTTGNLRTTLNQVAGVAISTGNGVSGTGVLRVAQVSDGTGVIATVGAVTAITNALPAGTNAIGKLAANSGVTIGDVNIISNIPGTGALNLGKAEDAPHTSGDVGVMALAVRNDNGTVLAGSDGDYLPMTTDSSGALRVDINGTISTNNSTTSVLAGGATFTGTSDETLIYNEIRVSVIASHASASDGLSIQQSTDNTNWDITDTYTIPAATAKTYSVPRQARYFRVVYTNGGTLQTSFRLQTILNRLGSRVSSQRPGDAYTNETDLEQQQSFLMGYNGTTWDRLRTVGTGVLSASSVLTAGAAIIGKVGIDQTTPGTTNLVALAANQSVNVAQMNGTTVTMGNGVAGTGVQRVTLASDSTANIATIGTSITPGTGATNLGKAEDVAAVSGDTGVGVLGVRNDTLASQTSASGDYGFHALDTAGILMTAGAPRLLKGRQVTTITSSTAETTIVTAIASTFLDIYGLILTNTSATATKVSIRDATAGGTISVFEVPPTDTRGLMLPLDSAIPQATVNNNWTATCGTSVASLEVTVLYVKRV